MMGESHTQFEPEHHASELASIPTCDLVNELAKRVGVLEFISGDPDSRYIVRIITNHGLINGVNRTGPARVLVVID